MKITAAAIQEYRLPLRARWLTAGGSFSERQGCLLRLEPENGASGYGVSAAAHLAAAIDNRLAHGLATSAWLAADTGRPPAIVDGRLLLPRAAGLGFTPAEETDFTPVAWRSTG